jgi:hypothetical protein
VIVAGTLPSLFLGYYVRVRYLPDPVTFKLFAGSVLFIKTMLSAVILSLAVKYIMQYF